HIFVFFFSSRRRHTRSKRDWSSDVCSSDLTCSAARHAGASTRSSASSRTTPTRGPIGWPKKCCRASIGGSSAGWSSYRTPKPEVTMQQPVDRRTFLEGAAAGAAALAWPGWTPLASRGLDDIQTEIERRHHEAVARLQQW